MRQALGFCSAFSSVFECKSQPYSCSLTHRWQASHHTDGQLQKQQVYIEPQPVYLPRISTDWVRGGGWKKGSGWTFCDNAMGRSGRDGKRAMRLGRRGWRCTWNVVENGRKGNRRKRSVSAAAPGEKKEEIGKEEKEKKGQKSEIQEAKRKNRHNPLPQGKHSEKFKG